MPGFLPRLFLLACLLLPLTAHADRVEHVGAAVATRSFAADLRFEDGAVIDRRFRRAGIEYWEGVTENIFFGFTVGYSENEGREPDRPFETVAGNYGSLGMLVDAPLTGAVFLRGRVEYLLQRDEHVTSAMSFETRTREARAEFGPLWRYRRVEFSLGASWRDLDYRETLQDDAGERVRHAEAVDNMGGFAALGIRTDNSGGIALRYDAGAEEGWALRFERTF